MSVSSRCGQIIILLVICSAFIVFNGVAQSSLCSRLSLNTLIKAYKANEIRADSLYNNRYWIITGYVRSINEGLFDEKYLELAELPMNSPDIALDFSGGDSVNAYLNDSVPKDFAINLNKGDKVILQCRCKGLSLGSVLLDDCTLIGGGKIPPPMTITPDELFKVFPIPNKLLSSLLLDDYYAWLQGLKSSRILMPVWDEVEKMRQAREKEGVYLSDRKIIKPFIEDYNAWLAEERVPSYDELPKEMREHLHREWKLLKAGAEKFKAEQAKAAARQAQRRYVVPPSENEVYPPFSRTEQ
ncbi:MAG: OB-fold protein [Syntrophobacteraceae bacterium]